MEPFLQLSNVSKTFGEVAALHNVNFEVGTNEIVGLLGDNGAGKSTIVKIITGYHQPDPGGEFYLKGKASRAPHGGPGPATWASRWCTRSGRWRTSSPCGATSSWAGNCPTAGAAWTSKGMRRETGKLMQTLMGFTSSAVTPESVVKTFSGGERQGVAITRALYFKAELIILDEPTMGLSLSETKKCLDFVAGISSAGKSAIFIDHNIFHVYPVADRIVVLDRGTVAGQFLKNELTLQELIDRLYLVAQTGSLNSGGAK